MEGFPEEWGLRLWIRNSSRGLAVLFLQEFGNLWKTGAKDDSRWSNTGLATDERLSPSFEDFVPMHPNKFHSSQGDWSWSPRSEESMIISPIRTSTRLLDHWSTNWVCSLSAFHRAVINKFRIFFHLHPRLVVVLLYNAGSNQEVPGRKLQVLLLLVSLGLSGHFCSSSKMQSSLEF